MAETVTVKLDKNGRPVISEEYWKIKKNTNPETGAAYKQEDLLPKSNPEQIETVKDDSWKNDRYIKSLEANRNLLDSITNPIEGDYIPKRRPHKVKPYDAGLGDNVSYGYATRDEGEAAANEERQALIDAYESGKADRETGNIPAMARFKRMMKEDPTDPFSTASREYWESAANKLQQGSKPLKQWLQTVGANFSNDDEPVVNFSSYNTSPSGVSYDDLVSFAEGIMGKKDGKSFVDTQLGGADGGDLSSESFSFKDVTNLLDTLKLQYDKNITDEQAKRQFESGVRQDYDKITPKNIYGTYIRHGNSPKVNALAAILGKKGEGDFPLAVDFAKNLESAFDKWVREDANRENTFRALMKEGKAKALNKHQLSDLFAGRQNGEEGEEGSLFETFLNDYLNKETFKIGDTTVPNREIIAKVNKAEENQTAEDLAAASADSAAAREKANKIEAEVDAQAQKDRGEYLSKKDPVKLEQGKQHFENMQDTREYLNSLEEYLNQLEHEAAESSSEERPSIDVSIEDLRNEIQQLKGALGESRFDSSPTPEGVVSWRETHQGPMVEGALDLGTYNNKTLAKEHPEMSTLRKNYTDYGTTGEEFPKTEEASTTTPEKKKVVKVRAKKTGSPKIEQVAGSEKELSDSLNRAVLAQMKRDENPTDAIGKIKKNIEQLKESLAKNKGTTSDKRMKNICEGISWGVGY